MTDREIFRKNLTEMIRVTNVKQKDIANYTEVSDQTVSAWVQGRGYPRADALERLCRFFGVKQSALTEDPGSEKVQERELLDAFRSLSDIGKEKALERVSEMITIYPKRSKKNG